MSTVPFTFANQNGNIPLVELDTNFANVKAYANAAGTVVASAQPSITSVGTLVSLSVTGNVNVGNVNSAYAVTGNTLVISTIDAVDSTVSVISDVAVSGNMSLTGTVTADTFQGNTLDVPRIRTNIISSDDSSSIQIQDGIEVYGDVLVNGDMTSNIVVTSLIRSGDSSILGIEDGLEVYGDVLTNGNVTAQNDLSAVGNIVAGAYFVGDGSQLTGVTAAAANIFNTVDANGTNLVASSPNDTVTLTPGTNVTIVGNATAKSATVGITTAPIFSGNLVAANISTVGIVSATGNIQGNYFIGNGSQLTGIGPVRYGNSNVITLLAGFGGNTVSTTGNITAGNILGGARVDAITHTGTTVSVTANITGGNILTAGAMSSTGNVTHGNISTGGLVTATGNITGGNLLTGGLVTATGNITGSNLLTGGLISSVGNIISGNLLTGGSISATGNITSGNLSAGNLVINNITSDDSSFVTINDGLEVYGNVSIIGDITSNTVVTSLISSGDSSVLGINDGLEVYGDVLANGNVTANTFISSGNIAVASDARRVVFVSNVAPLVGDGNDGDIWFQY